MNTVPTRRSLTRDFNAAQLVPSLAVGLITGIAEVMLTISFAALVFSGALSPYLSQGIGIALLGAIISGVVVALFTSIPGVVSGNQDVPSAIVAVAAVGVSTTLPAAAGGRALFVTVVVLIGLTTVLTGLLFVGLAQARLGNLVRFLPYPVVGGFLAATGWVLLLGGIGIAVDFTPTLKTLPRLLETSHMAQWIPLLLLALLLVFSLKRIEHIFTLPALIFGSVGIFYLLAIIGGQSTTTLSAAGWLLGPFPAGNLWQPFALGDLTLVHWPSLLAQAASAATLMFMSTIALLLNCSGLELALGRDMSLNRELRAAGAGNILAGAVGGFVSFQQLGLSSMNHKAGSASRLTGLIAAAVCTFVLLLGGATLSLFPKFVLGSLVAFLGISFLVDTLIDNWSKLPATDYAVIILILLVAATVGFMEAVAVGLLVAVILFVVKYSRIDLVRNELDGRTAQSRVTRSPEKCRILDASGDQLLVFRLQGFIFFGTADSLLARIRARLENPQQSPTRFLLLDFAHVTGVDSTALLSFSRLVSLARQRRISLILTQPVPELQLALDDLRSEDTPVRVFSDLDRGLEWCEEQRLASLAPASKAAAELRLALAERLADPHLAERLLAYFHRQEVDQGHVLMRQHEASDHLYLLESGQITAYLQEEDGSVERLQTMQDWNVLGEIGFFLGSRRTASVVVEAPGVIYCLSRQALHQMQEDDPRLAAALQNLIVQLLAERVVHLVAVVDALRR